MQRRLAKQRKAKNNNNAGGFNSLLTERMTLNRGGGVNGGVMSVGMQPVFPVRTKKMLRYSDSFQVATGAFVAGNYVYSANGLYDPNITGTGHQPMGFDQIMLYYNHYVCTKARITVKFRNQDADDTVTVGIRLHASPTPNTDPFQIMESGQCVSEKLLQSGVAGSACTLTASMDIAKFAGKKFLVDDNDQAGTISANPNEQSYFHVFAYNNESINVVNWFMEVVIDYEAWFIEPRVPSLSLTKAIHLAIVAERDREVEKKEAPEQFVVVTTTTTKLPQPRRGAG